MLEFLLGVLGVVPTFIAGFRFRTNREVDVVRHSVRIGAKMRCLKASLIQTNELCSYKMGKERLVRELFNMNLVIVKAAGQPELYKNERLTPHRNPAMLKTLALAAALTQVAIAAPMSLEARQTPQIIFDTKSLTIEDSNFGAELSVSLASAPSGVATVYLEAPGLQLTQCSLKFTPEDFKTPKKIRVIGGGSAKTTDYKLNAQVFALGSAAHLAKDTVAVTRKAWPSAHCYSNGDPHYKTFDGKYYSAQGHGVYYLVKTPSLVIQADQQPCAQGVTCNRAVAIQYGGSVISLAAAPNSKTAMALNLITKSCDGITATANTDKSQYQVTISDGTELTVSIYPWNGVYYMDVSINIAGAQYGKTDGLCGTYNQNANDDVANPATYAVSNAENIFYNGKGLDLKVSVPPSTHSCKMPELGSTAPTTDGVAPGNLPVGWGPIAINVPSATVVSEFIASSIQYASEKIMKANTAGITIPGNMAATFCASIRTMDDWCSANIDVDYFVGACAADLTNSGDMGIVTNAQKSFMSACAAKASCDAKYVVDIADATKLIGKATDMFAKIRGAAVGAIASHVAPAPAVSIPSMQLPGTQAPSAEELAKILKMSVPTMPKMNANWGWKM
ncbi:hypothetical protein HDU67_005679 [Dinochytrium kinnereticum]|nr:hypothetical protein HDU67_005679 [Dinochytrium kinnereticum]